MTATRLVPVKNIEVLVKAMAEPGTGTLRVFGDGPQGTDLAELAHSLGSLIEWCGTVGRDFLAHAYHDADALLFPSKGEGLPLVLIEAAAVGCPVIASELPANKEVMGDAALYCDPDDPLVWAEAMRRVATDPTLAQRLREAGLRRAEFFTVDRMASGYAAILKS